MTVRQPFRIPECSGSRVPPSATSASARPYSPREGLSRCTASHDNQLLRQQSPATHQYLSRCRIRRQIRPQGTGRGASSENGCFVVLKFDRRADR